MNGTGRYLHFRKGQVLGVANSIREEELNPNVSSVQKQEENKSEEKSIDTPADKLAAFNLDHVPEEHRQKLTECLLENIDVIFLYKMM